MDVHIAKWGNSCGIRIPKAVLQRLDLSEGEDVSLKVKDDKIIIKKKIAKPHYDYEKLIAEMKHCKQPKGEFPEDDPIGDEAW